MEIELLLCFLGTFPFCRIRETCWGLMWYPENRRKVDGLSSQGHCMMLTVQSFPEPASSAVLGQDSQVGVLDVKCPPIHMLPISLYVSVC